MGNIPPIDVGAKIAIARNAGPDPHRIEGRVLNIYIDEDGNAQVSINWQIMPHHDRPTEKVTYDDIREMLEAGEIERTNTGHEAWKWRTENVAGI
jgi:hypothetical protein